MTLYTSHFSPFSPFYQSQTHSGRLSHLRGNPFVSHSPSAAYQHSSHFTDDVLDRFDRIDVLGGPDRHRNDVGHEGCVNALAWSQSGHCLATGSDDTKVILWKLGSSDKHPRSVQHTPGLGYRAHPKLDLAQADIIQTGHRANIFNVKWAPNCSDRRLFTCAGDCQVRVFDLSRATSSTNVQISSGKEYRLWEQKQGACIRVLKCHSSRAKKISTENSPDVFLTAAEDGEVRQTDLRVPHTCSRSQGYGQGCPRPLMQFRMELYSLSLSKMEPWLFAVAGTSDKVYLQDRRMIPRLLRDEWGSHLDEETAALTHCVRRFSREADGDASVGKSTRSRYERAHVTAVKISEANGRDLLASYSGDGVFRFDIKGEPGSTKQNEKTSLLYSSKRRKTASGSVTPQPKTVSEGHKWDRIRTRMMQVLFSSNFEQSRSSKTYTQLRQDVDQLTEAVTAMSEPASWLTKEQSVIALCKVLIYIKAATTGRTESVELNLDSQKADVEMMMSADVRDQFVSLLEEMEEANKWKAYSEEVKVRMLLWERAEEYIKGWWGNLILDEGNDELAEVIESSTSRDTGLTEQEGRDSAESLNYTTFNSRFQANLHSSSDSSLFGRFSSITDSDGDEGEDEDDDDDDEMDEDDEDDDEEDDDDMSPSFTDQDSSEDELSNRHGISGGNAPLVYPTGSFTGHANNETVKDCGFLGSNDEYIWSGSDCGHFFIWSNDEKAQLKGLWRGDGSVVNVLSQHPTLPICAVSGIDETVKIFGPVASGSRRIADALDRKEDIMQRNSRQESLGISSQSIMRLFAQHLDIPRPGNGGGGGGSGGEQEEEQDCTIM